MIQREEQRKLSCASAAFRMLAVTCALAASAIVHAAGPTAEAEMKPTSGNTAAGTVRFTQTAQALLVEANLTGLTPGAHGFHLHEKGDCSAPDATSAGGHFNPSSQHHGGPDQAAHHGGDFGNIVADAEGKASLSISVPLTQISLNTGDVNSVIGRGVIVHADADDFATQPTGNAGKRVACGVVRAGT